MSLCPPCRAALRVTPRHRDTQYWGQECFHLPWARQSAHQREGAQWHSHQQCLGPVFTSLPTLTDNGLKTFASRMSVKWQFIILLFIYICISLIIKEVEHLFIFTRDLVSSSVNFLFISVASISVVKPFSYWFIGV